MKPIESSDDPRFVRAMSHPARARIMAMLGERAASPNELAGWLGATVGGTAYHVRKLYELGLLELTDEVRVRGAVEHFYRARPLPMRAGAASRGQEADASASLVVLQDHLHAAAAHGAFDRPEAVVTRRVVHVDERGWKAIAAEAAKLLERIEKIERAAAPRLESEPDDGRSAEAGVALLTFVSRPLADEIPPSPRRARARRAPGLPPRAPRRDTAAEVLAELAQEPATAATVAERTGLPLSGVRLAIRQLLAGQRIHVIDAEAAPSGRGRPRLVYTVVAD